MNKFKTKLAAFFRGEGFVGSSMTALVIGVVIAVNAIVYAFTTAFGLYLYVPDSYDMSISGATDALFAEVKDSETVKVIFCRDMNVLENGAVDEVTAFYETAKEFAERYPGFVEIECVNLITKRNQDGDLCDLTKYQIELDDGTLYPMYETSVVFVSEISHKVVTDIASATCTYDTHNSATYGQLATYNGEEVFASMALWVLKEDHPTAYFTTFHGEVVDVTFANMLSCAGYNIDTIDLRSVDMVPEDAGMVVIYNPVKDFERATEGSGVYSEIEKLDAYLGSGGSLYVAIDPYVEKLSVLEAFLSDHGITLSEAQGENGVVKNIVRDSENAVTTDYFTLISELAESELGGAVREDIAAYGSLGVLMRETAALELSGNAKPLLVSSDAAETYAGGVKTGSEGNYCLAATAVTENENGSVSRVVVVPSIFLCAQDMLMTDGYANRNFIYSLFENLFGRENMPYGCKTTLFYTNGTLENLTMQSARIYTAIIMTIPAALAIVGAVIVIRRKNR
jgi:hypothetical protein